MDDFIITHKEPVVNDTFIRFFNEKYGKITKVSVHRGLKHYYLGMTLDFSQTGNVKVLMAEYVNRMVEEASENFSGVGQTPATNQIFDIDEDAQPLDEQKASRCHHIVAKALFLCKRSRPDIKIAVGFLITRVRASTDDDWKKLK